MLRRSILSPKSSISICRAVYRRLHLNATCLGEKKASPGALSSSFVDTWTKYHGQLSVQNLPKVNRDLSLPYVTNTCISYENALSDYLLTPEDLKDLKYEKEEEEYSEEVSYIFKRHDIIKKAIEVHGSIDELDRKRYEDHKWDLSYEYELYPSSEANPSLPKDKEKPWLLDWKNGEWLPGEKVALCAIGVNLMCFLLKTGCFIYTGSSSVFAEILHSLADLVNQTLLLYSVRKAVAKPDKSHPYGYTNVKHIAALFGGIGIFMCGAVVGMIHSSYTLFHLTPTYNPFMAVSTMLGMTALESITLALALKEVREKSKESNISMWNFIKQNRIPSTNVVLLEDALAVGSTLIASCFIGISYVYGVPWLDPVGGIIISLIMGFTASQLIRLNIHPLTMTSIDTKVETDMKRFIESDPCVRYIRDVKTTNIAGAHRLKAEIDYDGGEITNIYQSKLNMEQELEIVNSIKTKDDLRVYLLNHGNEIINQNGTEINRIEKALKARFPDLKHVDFEPI